MAVRARPGPTALRRLLVAVAILAAVTALGLSRANPPADAAPEARAAGEAPEGAGAAGAAIAGAGAAADRAGRAETEAAEGAGAVVTVTDADGDVVAREPLPADGAFALRYRHSVYDVPARERFAALPEGGFRMLGVSSPSEAVLDYYGLPGTRRRAGGWWHLELAEPSLHDRLALIATPRGRRTLEVPGAATALHPAEGSRHLVIAVERR